jgi:hypothetical protein
MLLLAIAQLGNGGDTRAFNYLDYLDSNGFGDAHKEDKSAAPVPKPSKTKPESSMCDALRKVFLTTYSGDKRQRR